MGFFDRVPPGAGAQRPLDAASADEQAIARYRYLVRTAPPETIEQAHAEAFAQLTPAQRRRVLEDLAASVPAGGERAAVLRAGDDPAGLARAATRAELRQPGLLERVFGGPAAGGPGLGSVLAGSLLASMAGTVIGSAIAQHFLAAHPAPAGFFGDSAHALADDSARAIDDLATTGDEGTEIGDADIVADPGFDDGGFFDV